MLNEKLNLEEKIFKNSLIIERLERLSLSEKSKAITKLLNNKTQKQLSQELGFSESTISDWKTMRRREGTPEYHTSLNTIINKLENFKITNSDDTFKLIQIKKIVDNLLE